MSVNSEILEQVGQDFANVIPAVDEEACHERWNPGIGPFEEEAQLEMILTSLADDSNRPKYIETEVPYPESGKRCDLFIEHGSRQLPVEVKLLRFSRDNGNIDPNMYKSIFSPFPERSSSSLLTDTRKLAESGFEPPYGLIGLYYEKNEEEYEQLRAERIAEKFEHDVEYWYNLDIDTVAVNRFSGLQHPHHQHGAVIAWLLPEDPPVNTSIKMAFCRWWLYRNPQYLTYSAR